MSDPSDAKPPGSLAPEASSVFRPLKGLPSADRRLTAGPRVCPVCHTSYESWIEFCFKDGAALLADSAPAPLPPPPPLDAPTPRLPSAATDLPEPAALMRGRGEPRDSRFNLDAPPAPTPSRSSQDLPDGAPATPPLGVRPTPAPPTTAGEPGAPPAEDSARAEAAPVAPKESGSPPAAPGPTLSPVVGADAMAELARSLRPSGESPIDRLPVLPPVAAEEEERPTVPIYSPTSAQAADARNEERDATAPVRRPPPAAGGRSGLWLGVFGVAFLLAGALFLGVYVLKSMSTTPAATPVPVASNPATPAPRPLPPPPSPATPAAPSDPSASATTPGADVPTATSITTVPTGTVPTATAPTAAAPTGATPTATVPNGSTPTHSPTPTATTTTTPNVAATTAPATPKPAPAPTGGEQPWATPAGTSTPAPAGTSSEAPWGASTEVSSGTLTVTADPADATIRINGQNKGKGRVAVPLAYGSHEVKVEKTGYSSEIRTIQLQVREMSVPITLRPQFKAGQVTLECVGIDDCRVIVDGTDVGALPRTVNLAEGVHAFKVSGSNGVSCQRMQAVTLDAEGAATVTLRCN